MKKNTRGRRLSVLFGLMIVAGIFFGGGEARADTFYVNFITYPSYAAQTIFTATLDKSSINPYVTGETIRATGQAVSATCGNSPGYDFINYFTHTETAVINGSPALSILNTTTNFTAQGSAGSYNALIHATSTNPFQHITGGSTSINLPYTVISPNVLKICPSNPTVLTLNQGSSQPLGLYYDTRVAGDCNGAGTLAPTGSWSITSPYISLSPEPLTSGNTKTVTAVNTGETVTHSGNTVTATYSGKTATANVTVAAIPPACTCNLDIASTKCSTEMFSGTVIPSMTPPAASCIPDSNCSGIRDCSASWRELSPTQ